MADETLTSTPAATDPDTSASVTTHLLIVPHTHWDREWYQTFQQFRMRLVRAVDAVLDTLDADPAFTYFMLDGQTIVLDDYLEVRPENAPRLRRLAREGRLLVGPWYLQPDEYLVGGEALIRNLQFGRRGAAEYGGAMPVGYVPDTFGHIAQLPQILCGFELDNAVFWRGVGAQVERNVFRWAAPDGSEVLALWLHDQYGYSNAAVLPFDPAALVARLDGTAGRMRPKALTNTLLMMNGSDHQEPQPGLPAALAAAAPLLAARGLDATLGTLPQYVNRMRQAEPPLECHRGELRSGHYAHLLPGVLSTRMWLKQANAAGEALLVRWAEPATALAAFSVSGAGAGATHPTALLDLAWKHLLQCHPHDSICGCGIDQVHAEMLPRFAQSAQIAEELTIRALDQLAAQADTRGPARAVPLVVFNPTAGPRTDTVRAPAQIRFARYVVADDEGQTVPFQVAHTEGQVLLDERVDAALVAAMMGMLVDGRALGYAVLDAAIAPSERPGEVAVEIVASQTAEPELELVERLRDRMIALANGGDVTTFHIVAREAPRTELLLLARDVPGHGGRVFFVRPLDESRAESGSGAASGADRLAVEPLALENAHLRVEVNPADGTLTLRDKRAGRVYAGLNQLADSGDVGDLYNWSPPAADVTISAPLWPPDVTTVESGPARATLRIQRTYALPAAATPDRTARGGEWVTCTAVSEVSLVPGARRVEIRTTVENTARDHRLRAIFPLPFTADHADAEGVFEVARRAAQLPGSAPGAWTPQDSAEQPVNTMPQKRFVDLSDGTAGLALLNRGLPEYEVLPPDPDPDAGRAGSAVALTLLRGVEWLSRDDLTTRRGHAGPPLRTPEGQGLGMHVFEYALVPHAGDWTAEDALVPREAEAFEAPLRAVATAQHDGPLGSHWSAAYVTPAAVRVSAIKRPAEGDGLVVRLYNPLQEEVEAEVILNRPFSSVEVLNLAEDRVRPADSAQLARILSTGVRSRLRGGEIQTLRFRSEGAGE